MRHLRIFSIFLTTGIIAVASAQNATLISFGQQDPQFTQYALSPAMFNPAAVGLDESWTSTLFVRSQWVGLPGAPVSQNITSNVPIYRISSGVGVNISNDIAGLQRNTGAQLAYAFHKHFLNSTLSFGLSGGIRQQTINGDKLVTPTGTYGDLVDHNDPNLPVTTATSMIPDAAAGVYFFSNDLQAGVAVSQLLLPLTAGILPDGAAAQYNSNAYVYVAYGFDVGTRFRIMPNVLYKTDLNTGVIDLNTLLTFENRIIAGVSGRTGLQGQTDALGIIAGIRVAAEWQISYAYDITLSALNTASAGSHEIVIRYSIPVAKPRAGKMVNNPRFLYH